ncbi:MAG: hypothetical protein U9R53_07455 [Chloroflexota bacterium]|nr:hypothetical protein [Chloroflexota bacterium]
MDEFLNNILRGLITYNIGIFFLLGLGFLIYLRKFILGLREWKASVFGLERHMAKRKLASASTGLILLILLFIGEFLLITVIGPQMPAYSTAATLKIDPFITPTTTLSSGESQAADRMLTPTIGKESLISECQEGILEITSPGDGDEVSGTVEIIGTVNIEDFGSYKYEYSTTGVVDWVTIAAGNQLKLDENLGYWYTSALQPGIYLLQLVPLNNVGDELTPCIITVEVVTEE